MKFTGFIFLILFNLQALSQELIPYRKFSKWGYSDKNGKLIIQPQFDRAWFFQSNGLAVIKNSGRQYLINKQGKIISKKDYAIIGILSNEKIIAARKANGRGSELYYSEWINLSLTGEELNSVPTKADIQQLTGEKIEIQNNCSTQMVEQKLEKDQFILFTPQGNLLSTGSLQCLNENLFIAEAIVDTGITRFGVIDANLKTKIPFKFSSIIGLLNNYIVVSSNGKRGIFNLEGKEIIPPKYGNIIQAADDFVLVSLSPKNNLDESLGYVHVNGHEYFESNPVYQVGTIDEHLTITDQYQNRIGFPVIDFEEASVINNKYVLLVKDAKHFLYSIDGDLLLEAEKIEQLGSKRFLAEKNFLLQVYDTDALKIVYDSLHFASLLSDPYSNTTMGYIVRNNEGKFGALDLNGKLVVKTYYTFLHFNGMYFLGGNAMKETILMDSTGNTLKHFSTANVRAMSYHFFSVREKEKFSVYDARTDSYLYKNLIPVENQTEIDAGIILTDDQLYGYLNPNTETVVEPIYTDAGYFQTYDVVNPYLIIYYFKKKNGKYDLYNTSIGKFIATDLDQVKKPAANWIPVYKNNRLSFIDNSGNLILEDGIEDFNAVNSTVYLAIKKNGKFGVLNTEKELLVDFKYNNITAIADDFVIAEKDNLFGLIDINDSLWIPFQYQSLKSLTTLEDTIGDIYLFMAEKNGKKGIINQFNKSLTPFEIEGEVSFPFSQNYFVVTSNGKASWYDKSNIPILKNIGEEITAFPNEDPSGNAIAIVRNKTNYGLYNSKGKCLVPIELDRIYTENNYYDFYERFYALVEKKGKLGFVSLETGMSSTPQFDALDEEGFSIIGVNTFLPVKLKNKWGILKNYNELMLPCQYDELFLNPDDYQSGIIRIKQNGKFGLVDTSGKLILNCSYDELILGETINEERLIELIKGGKHGIYSNKKGILIEAEYDKIGVLYLNKPAYTALKGKYFAVFDPSGKQILPCEMVKPIKSQDPAYPITFQDKNGKKWGIGFNFEVKEIQ